MIEKRKEKKRKRRIGSYNKCILRTDILTMWLVARQLAANHFKNSCFYAAQCYAPNAADLTDLPLLKNPNGKIKEEDKNKSTPESSIQFHPQICSARLHSVGQQHQIGTLHK